MQRVRRRIALTVCSFAALTLLWTVPDVDAAAKKGAKTAVKKGTKGKKGKAKGKAKAGDDAATKEAKDLFAKGKLFFDSGQFEKALGAYTSAYEKKALSGFLINIAQCHRNLGSYEQALFFYNKYLTEEPDTPLKAEIKATIAELEVKWDEWKEEEAKRLAAEKAGAEATAEADRKERASLEAIRASEAAKAARLEADAAKSRAEEARSSKPFYQRVWFWSVVGGAIVAAGTVTTLGFVLSPTLPGTTLGTVDCRDMSCAVR